MEMNSTSWMNNSASLLKIALDSASLFSDSASQVAKPKPFELRLKSVSWTGLDSEISRLDESWAGSASREGKVPDFDPMQLVRNSVRCRGQGLSQFPDFGPMQGQGLIVKIGSLQGARIAKFLMQAIEFVGPSNVLQFVTDNVANCIAAGKELEKVYKHIFWSPCCVHTLNLIFKDFAHAFIWLEEGEKDCCDGEGPKMGEIYEKMDNMLGEIKEAMMKSMYESYFHQVEEIVLKRWEKMNIPLHCLGFALSPRFYDTRYLEKLAPGEIRRKAPNLDKEVIQGVMQAFNCIAENRDEE
uniref:DUF659 domain-containing protein n=1 Tax=Lactuca sativa TaxID=4236 RepID=A0A9R1X0D5_LACSA|nr:hypothetical protein LSAT_V11C800398380 [Lactuca sativa]